MPAACTVSLTRSRESLNWPSMTISFNIRTGVAQQLAQGKKWNSSFVEKAN